MSVTQVERPPRKSESKTAKHYNYIVRWRYYSEGTVKQPKLIVGNPADAYKLDERMKIAPVASAAEARTWLKPKMAARGVPVGTYDPREPELATAPTLRAQILDVAENRIGLKQQTRKQYMYQMRYLGPLLDVPIDLVTPQLAARQFAEGMEQLAPSTRKLAYNALIAGLRNSGIRTEPYHEAFKRMNWKRKVKPLYLTDAQIQSLLDTAKSVDPETGEELFPETYGPVRVMLDLGLRTSECFGLTSEYVDLDAREVHIVQQRDAKQSSYARGLFFTGVKGDGASSRTLPLSDSLVKLLEDYVDPERPELPIFRHAPYTFMSTATWRNKRRELAAAAPGVPNRLRTHDLRHSAVDRWRRNGVDIADASRALGHSSISITIDMYQERWSTRASDTLRQAMLP